MPQAILKTHFIILATAFFRRLRLMHIRTFRSKYSKLLVEPLHVFNQCVFTLLHKQLEETALMSCSFVVIVILRGGGYGHITSLPMSPLHQSNDSIVVLQCSRIRKLYGIICYNIIITKRPIWCHWNSTLAQSYSRSTAVCQVQVQPWTFTFKWTKYMTMGLGSKKLHRVGWIWLYIYTWL